MLPRTTLLWINRVLWTVLVAVTVLLGVFVSLGRHYIPYVETHQRELIDELNRRTGLQFSVGHIRGNWQHLAPHFSIDDLRLYHPQHPDDAVLEIEHVELKLGIFRSLHAGTIAISELSGRGVRLQLEEAPLGRWHLAGFAGGGEMKLDAVLDFLLAIYRAELKDTQLDLQFFGGGEAHLAGETLKLQRAGEFRRLNLELAFATDGAPLRLVVETHGDPRSESSFSGRGYLAFKGVDLTPILPAAKAFGVDLTHGRIDGSAWLDWQPGGVIEVRGRAALPQLDLAGISGQALAPVKNIAAEFLVRDNGGRRQLWLPALAGEWNGTALDFRQLLFSSDAARSQTFQLALPELQLAPLRDMLLADGSLPVPLHDTLAALQPSGTLRNLRIDIPIGPEQAGQLRLRAELQAIAVAALHGAPGVEGASGYIDAGLHGGTVDLASDAFAMDFPHVYHEALRFDRVRGRIAWQLDDDGVRVQSGPIPVHGDAGTATAQFSLDLPHEGTPLMTLLVGLRDSDARYRNRFIPYTLDPHLLEWLNGSIAAGKLPLGGFIYRGSLLAHDHANNTVQLFLDVRDGQLNYQQEWPPLHALNAAVWVDDDGLLVQAPSARIYDRIAVKAIEVELEHPPEGSWLTVQADADGEGDDVLRLLRETPLRKHVGGALDRWRWRGPTHSQLELGIPLSGTGRSTDIQVDSTLGPGVLSVADQNIVLEDLRGTLSYRNEGGLQAPALSGKWYGKPVSIKVATAADGTMTIDSNGRIAMVDLRDWLQQPLFDYARGDSAFAATLHIAAEHSTLQVRSDLVGAELQLPPPYAKSAEQPLALLVNMNVGDRRDLVAELGDWADLRLRWENSSSDSTITHGRATPSAIDAAVLRLGQAGKTAFARGQLVITGAVPAIDLSLWRDVLAHSAASDPAPAAEADSAPALAVQLRELHFGEVVAAGQNLRDLILSGRRDSSGWTLQLRAEQLAGVLTLPAHDQPWRAQLNYLRLPAPVIEPPASAAPAAGASKALLDSVDPATISAVDLHIDHLWRGEEELGWIDLQLRPIENGLRLDKLSGQLRAVTIEPRGEQPASLSWTRRDGVHRSEFSGRLAVGDIRTALQRWQYEPVLTSKSGHIDIALHWTGRPDEFKFSQSEGDTDLLIDDGRFLKASSSATGALKVVGIFNFANFLRRLQLDFSDVFKDGVSFDEMKGGLSLQGGVLKTDEPVEIKSPASRFRVAGQIDFNTDQTDMELVATLPVASNLPWIAALAGGLPMAAGVYVASKIFEGQVDRFASAAYDIHGPWMDPQVKLSRVFNDKLQAPATQSSSAPAAEPVSPQGP